jgi:hypothetical protein
MKKKLLVGLAVGMMMLGIGGVASATTLTATQDRMITDGFDGDVDTFLSGNWPDEWQNVGLVQFDTSALSWGPLSSATLNLYHLYNTGNGADFGIYANTSAWDENTIWGTAPSYNNAAFAHLTINDNSTDLWRNVDITSLVEGWANGSIVNYGIRIQRLDQLNPFVFFESSENTHAPYLDVNGSAPVPEPATMLLMGIGIAGLIAARRRKKA